MLKVLVTPTEGEMPLEGHYSWTDKDELVTVENLCPCSDAECHRGMIGVDSRRRTTVAQVALRDITVEAFVQVVTDSMLRAWGSGGGPELMKELVSEARSVAEDTLEQTSRFEVGDMVIKSGRDAWLSNIVEGYDGPWA